MYWRMQLHPSEAELSVKHAITSLAAGYIGLDFGKDLGDLHLLKREELPDGQRDYWDFAHVMKQGDLVLVVAHHFPFALAKVAGPYSYISHALPHIGVWFRHFRAVRDISYYGDWITNAHKWRPLKMTDTISPLHDTTSQSYMLIDEWRSAA